MSPRDYKPTPGNGRGRDAQAPRYGSWMSFVSGLGFGLVVAFGVYLWSASLPPPSDLVDEARELTGTATSTPAVPAATDTAASEAVGQAAADAQADEAGADTATPYEAPRPTFDFYKILPEMEVPVPADETADTTAPPAAVETPPPAVPPAPDGTSPPPVAAPPVADEGSYILQVGSFRSFDDAEAAKAKLALRGISASVQRVVINGQDIWFRVHIGPLSDAATLRAVRMKLTELDVSFILLKVGGGAAAAPGR